jgi:hypothetical protein
MFEATKELADSLDPAAGLPADIGQLEHAFSMLEVEGRLTDKSLLSVGEAALELRERGAVLNPELAELAENAKRAKGEFSDSHEGVDRLAQSLYQMQQILKDFGAGGIASKIFGGMSAGVSAINSVTTGFGQMKESFAAMATSGKSFGNIMGAVGGMMGFVGPAIAGVGLLIKGIKKLGRTTEENLQLTVARQWGAELSDKLAKSIAETADKIGDDYGALITHLGDVIDEAGGVMAFGLDNSIASLRDVFVMIETGVMTTEEAGVVIERVFPQISKAIVDNNQLASDSFLELIELQQRFGVESEAVTNFIKTQLGTISSGIAANLQPLVTEFEGTADAIQETSDNIKELQAEGVALTTELSTLEEGTSEYKRVQEELAANTHETTQAQARLQDQLAAQGAAAESSSAQVASAGLVLVSAFNAALDKGMSLHEAVDAIGPSLDSLLTLQTELGVQSEDAAVKQLTRYRDLVNNNKELVEGAATLNETTLALSRIGALNKDTLEEMGKMGVRQFEDLTEAGFTENEALQQMKGFLETVRDRHLALGEPVDENTQRLIDQATEQGILETAAVSMADVMKEGLGAIIELLGGDLPLAWSEFEGATDSAARKLEDEGVNMSGAVNNVKGAIGGAAREFGRIQHAIDGLDYGRLGDIRDEIDGISFGSSPGGLKEIPKFLAESSRMMKEFSKTAIRGTQEARRAIDRLAMEAPSLMGSSHAASGLSAPAGGQIANISVSIDARGARFEDRESMRELGLAAGDEILDRLLLRLRPQVSG